MKRLLLLTSVALVAAGMPTLAFALQTRAQSPRVVTVHVGDVVRIPGVGNVGCKVVRRDGFQTLDCRRAGPLAGSYGALLNKRELLVVRFESGKTAKIIVDARHDAVNPRICS
jgi:hypothetical protein